MKHMKSLFLKLILIPIIFIFASKFVLSQTWLTGWAYRIPITIQETSGNNLINYPVNLTIDTASLIAAGKLNADCSDIRFTDASGNLLPYYIESGCDTTSTKIWVKIPYLAANSQITIYMYYGNPSATSASSVTSVFSGYTPDLLANYSTTYQTPFCSFTNSCTTGSEVICRDNILGGVEPNAPNTIFGSCSDGTLGTCHSDESTEEINVSIPENRPIMGGDTITINVEYWCWGTADYVAIWVSLDNGTTWTNVYSGTCPYGGNYYTVTATYTIPPQLSETDIVVRGQILYASSPTAACVTGSYNDHDDLVLNVYRGGYYPNVTLGSEQSYVNVNVIDPNAATWNVSSSLDYISTNVSVTNSLLVISSPQDNLTASLLKNPFGYICLISPTLVTASDLGSYTFNVSCVPSFEFSLNPSQLDVFIGFYNTTNLSLIIHDPTVTYVTFNCSSPDPNLQCTIIPNNLTTNGTAVVNITANPGIQEGIYQLTITGVSNTGVVRSETLTVNVKMVKIYYTVPTPANGTNLSYVYLPIGFYTTVSDVVAEINGVNYTLTVTPDTTTVISLYYNYTVPAGLPTLYQLVGSSGGYVTFRLYAIGPVVNATEYRTVYVPPVEFYVNYIAPTPTNATISDVWILQVAGDVVDNTLSKDYCYLELLNPNTSSWDNVTYMPNCETYLYNDQLKAYAFDTGTNYAVWYRIELVNSQNMTYIAPIRVLYFNYSAKDVEVVTPSLSSSGIQFAINNAVANGINYIVFAPGIYRVNLIINVTQPVTLLGAGAIMEPLSVASPIITILNGNVTVDGFNLNSRLFTLRIYNGNLIVKNTNINSALYGIQTTSNSSITVENSNVYGKVAAIYASRGLSNSEIINSKISSQVWGIYLKDAFNVTVNSSYVTSKVFGILVDGNSTYNVISNSTVNAKIFGIYIKKGQTNYIENSTVTSEIFAIKLDSANNIVNNVIINNQKVFGIYSSKDNIINNVTVYGGLFGAYLTGNASNLYLYGAKLGIYIFGNGTIQNLTLSSGKFSIQYLGSVIIRSSNKAPQTIPGYSVIFANNQFELLGGINANITFVPAVPGNYTVAKIVGKLINVIATGTSFSPSGYGVYALYEIP